MRPKDKNAVHGQWWDKSATVVKGCTKVSAGCENCWSMAMGSRFNTDLAKGGDWTGKIVFDIAALEKAVKGEPKVITIWNDLFHEGVDSFNIGQALGWMEWYQKHLFLILTKRIERAARLLTVWGSIIPNVWLGTSAESQAEWDERVPILLNTPAAKRFVSVEPMLGPVDLSRTQRPLAFHSSPYGWETWFSQHVQLVIIGCESGPKRRPCEIEWVTDLVRQCVDARVPVWVKQLSIGGKVVKDMAAFPDELRRREWPEGGKDE